MPNNNKIMLGLLAFAIVFGGSHVSQAQENQTIHSTPVVTTEQSSQELKSPTAPKTPIVIEADNLSFSDETGDIVARGNVVITNQGHKVEAELINGNAKLSEIWINDEARFSQSDSNLTGYHTLYNYKLKTGSMEDVKGQIGRKYVSGDMINIYPEQYVIDHGSTTNCPAKVPDYHISADKIEIWPGEQMIAYNAKFWIGNKVIFSLPKYRQSLDKKDETSFPSIGYDSEQGIYIKQHIDYPLNDKLSAIANLDYYSKADFKPNFGLLQREKNFSIGVAQGHFLDDDDNWIKKEPEFKFVYNPHRLGSLPVSYTFTAIYGKWKEDDITSWHQEYELYFSRDPIKLSNTMNLYLGTGIEHIHESYNDSSQNIFKFDATLTKKWSERFNTWVGYHYTEHNDTLFEYDSDDLNREFKSGFTYKIDKMNAIGITRSYDLDQKRVEDLDYTWYRNLHCWEAKITYQAKKDRIKFDISTIRW